jgi:hypothetical protein
MDYCKKPRDPEKPLDPDEIIACAIKPRQPNYPPPVHITHPWRVDQVNRKAAEKAEKAEKKAEKAAKAEKKAVKTVKKLLFHGQKRETFVSWTEVSEPW